MATLAASAVSPQAVASFGFTLCWSWRLRMLPLKTLGHKSHEMRMRIEGSEMRRDGREGEEAVSKSVGSPSA